MYQTKTYTIKECKGEPDFKSDTSEILNANLSLIPCEWSFFGQKSSFTLKMPQKASAQRPCASAQRPCADAQRPSADAQRPSADAQRPSADAQRPCADAQRPSADAQRPSADAQRPSADAQRPSADAQRPSADDMFPFADATKSSSKMNQIYFYEINLKSNKTKK